MIDYNADIEKFCDHVDFGPTDPCIWVVYPAGAAGDLLASIINFHYVNTGSDFYGITGHGQTIFRPTDRKLVNQMKKNNCLEFGNNFFYDIARILGERNLNYSLLDQVLFSNHCWEDHNVKQILNSFTQSKIIRILPETQGESDIINWMSAYKNSNITLDLPAFDKTVLAKSQIIDSRLLDIKFSNLFQEQLFEKVYYDVVDFLNLPGPLIRYDFVDFWINRQCDSVREILKKLNELQ
jgi:hypothetical protein